MFSDLNILLASVENTIKSAKRAANFGYGIIAINKYHEDLSIKTSKKKNPDNLNQNLEIPENIIKSLMEENFSHGNNKLKLLTRFTTILSDPSQVVRLNKDPVIQKYDIISVRPTTEKLFLSACKDMDVDIISIDLTVKLDFIPKRSAINCAIKRNIYFEIVYSPMIRDATGRRNTISNANMLTDLTRGKNIIFSSGCLDHMELRSPYDVINLGLLFGLKQNQCKAALSENSNAILSHAASRRTKGVISVGKLESLGIDNLWKLPKSPNIIKIEYMKTERKNSDTILEEPPSKKHKNDS